MPSIKTKLMAHQSRAMKKIGRLKTAALFMDMGTGKTLTALTFAARKIRQRKAARCLWFCPVSTIRNVMLEIEKHTNFRVGRDIHVFGLQSLSRGGQVFEEAMSLAKNAIIIVDESQFVKNHLCKRAQRLLQICALSQYKLILTGTPICQGIEDLYSQFLMLDHKILGFSSFEAFAMHHLEYNEDYHPRRICNRRNQAYLMSRIAPYTFQIKKSECLNLPGKVFKKAYFRMAPAQRELYTLAKEEILRDMNAFTFGDTTVYRLFTALQQCVAGFYNSRKWGFVRIFKTPRENPRIQALLQAIEAVPDTEKIVIWAKFIPEIDDIVFILTSKYGSASVTRYDCSVSHYARHANILRFNTTARFFVANLSTGSLGIDLTAAAYVIYYSNSFKMQQRLQSQDRCHRLGQKKSVVYIDLESDARIDRIISNCLARRKDFIQEFKEKLVRTRQNLGREMAYRKARTILNRL